MKKNEGNKTGDTSSHEFSIGAWILCVKSRQKCPLEALMITHRNRTLCPKEQGVSYDGRKNLSWRNGETLFMARVFELQGTLLVGQLSDKEHALERER